MTHSSKIFRNSLFSFINKIVMIFLGFFTRKLFILFLSQELLGLNSLFADLLGLLNLADMGLGVAVQFELYKPIADHNYEKIGRILNATKRIYNVVGIAIIAVGAVMSLFIQHLIRENPYPLGFLRIVFIINVASSAATYFFVHKRLFLQACEDIHVMTFWDTVTNIAGTLLRLAAVAIFKNYYLYVLLSALQAIAANVLVAYFCDKRYPELQKIKGFGKEDITPLFRNIKELIPNKISAYVFSNTDNTIISSFIGLSSVAIFTNYTSIVLQLFTMATMLSMVIRSSFGNVLQETSDRDAHMLFLSSYQMLQFFYSSFCGVALFCLLDDFVFLWYGPEFLVSLPFVIILTVDFFLHSMYLPLSVMLEVKGEFRSLKYQEIFSMIVNIVVSVGLVFPFGIIGPIFGTLVVDICTTVFRLYTIVFKHYRPYLGAYLKKYGLYCVLFLAEFVGLYLLCSRIPLGRSWLSFILKGCLCFVAVMGLDCLVFWKTKEFSYLKNKVMHLLHRG